MDEEARLRAAEDRMNRARKRQRQTVTAGIAGGFILLVLIGACASIQTVGTGQEAVGVRFGKVTGDVLQEGFHFPVNPLNSWDEFSTLAKTMEFKGIEVPAADQQKATMDINVQVRLREGAALGLRGSVGVWDQVWQVHFIPNARGILRDAGRATEKVEAFYDETTIEAYRETARSVLVERLEPLGFEVTDVIVRDVTLPPVIASAIEAKKQREQEVERERAELERIALQAQQKVKQAEADRQAAEEEAVKIRTLAEAEAEKIRLMQQQLAKSPQYIELVKAEKWDGVLPRVNGGDMTPILDLRSGRTGG